MRPVIGTLLLMLIGLTGCQSTTPNLGRDDLVTIVHNQESEYTLLVYQSPTGKLRKVLRRKGVCELQLIEAEDGDVWLKERGAEPRLLKDEHIMVIEEQLNAMVYDHQEPEEQADADA